MSNIKKDVVAETKVAETRTCIDCGNQFDITVNEEEWYEKMGFEKPKRCKECRKKRKGDRRGKN